MMPLENGKAFVNGLQSQKTCLESHTLRSYTLDGREGEEKFRV